MFPVSGWVVAEERIEAVSVYVDRKFLTAVPAERLRPDVAAAKPEFANAESSGFGVAIDSTTLAPGWHELVVQARTTSGAVRDLAAVPVLVER
jgi:hypothetical protein